MKILLGIFLGLILVLLASSLKINVIYLNKERKSFKIKFNIKFGLYLFGIIKILAISLQEDGIHFFGFTFSYNKIKIDRDSMKILKDFSVFDALHLLNMKLEKLQVDLIIGTENMMLTVFLVFAISTFLSIICAKNSKQMNGKAYYYKVSPIYEQNELSFKISSQISIPIPNIIKTILFAKQHRRNKKQDKSFIRKIPIKI